MNTIINFETAKLLKEKGFDEPTLDCYNLNGLLFSNGWCEYIADDPEFEGLVYASKLKEKDVLAPTIADIVMWIYEKYGIWINVYEYKDFAADVNDDYVFRTSHTKLKEFNSPTEAYQEAINYTLKTEILIK